MTCIVTGATDSSGTYLGANYPAGIYLAADLRVAPTKYPLVATTEVGATHVMAQVLG
jgi:hypothetical protein